jgi:hypothetical protein
MSEHARAERRSLRYHAAVAERIARDPSVVPRARARVEAWLSTGEVAAFYAVGWRGLLTLPSSELCAFLVDRSERATAFRQVSPFAFVLSPQERWRLWAAKDDDDDATAA